MDKNIEIGSKFNRLTAVRPIHKGGTWEFKCDCGAVVQKETWGVFAGKIRSCGCLQIETRSSRVIGRGTVNLSGRRFGLLVAISSSTDESGRKMWLVKCDCGKQKTVRHNHLQSGKTTSCGCLAIEKTKAYFTRHGHSKTTEYNIWSSMKARCFNTSHEAYKNYGGRGIAVCERWRDSFDNFLADMGHRPDGLTLDRIDNNGN